MKLILENKHLIKGSWVWFPKPTHTNKFKELPTLSKNHWKERCWMLPIFLTKFDKRA